MKTRVKFQVIFEMETTIPGIPSEKTLGLIVEKLVRETAGGLNSCGDVFLEKFGKMDFWVRLVEQRGL